MDKDNGKKTIEDLALEKRFEGLILNMGDMVRQDGIIAEAVDKSKAQSLGVIQTMITAETDDANYRQMLKRARWKNQEHRDKFVKAIAVCRMTGAVKAAKTLFDLITADSAGDDGAWIQETIEGLTHTSLTTKSEIEKKKRQDDNKYRSSASPIS